ncbi:hypothetical protein NKH77_45765 [Streptomyces sp. M19]
MLPFMFTDVVLRASGATRVRVCLTRRGEDEVSVEVADATGAPVLSIGSLLARPLPDGDFAAVPQDMVLLAPRWTDLGVDRAVASDGWAVVGDGADYPDLSALNSAVEAGAPVPGAWHWPCRTTRGAVVPLTHQVTAWVLEQLQRWLGDQRYDRTRLIVLTRSAVTTGAGDPVTDLPGAAVWG